MQCTLLIAASAFCIFYQDFVPNVITVSQCTSEHVFSWWYFFSTVNTPLFTVGHWQHYSQIQTSQYQKADMRMLSARYSIFTAFVKHCVFTKRTLKRCHFCGTYLSVFREYSLSPLQPLGPNWNVAGAHLSQFLPTTFGLHWHWPPLGSHTVLREPWGSHWHSGKQRQRDHIEKKNNNLQVSTTSNNGHGSRLMEADDRFMRPAVAPRGMHRNQSRLVQKDWGLIKGWHNTVRGKGEEEGQSAVGQSTKWVWSGF